MTMDRERWATLSVKDHQDAKSLIPDILMYNHLIFPIPPSYDANQIKRWKDEGWDPNLLNKRLEDLQDIAIKIDWDIEHRNIFGGGMDEFKSYSDKIRLEKDLEKTIPYAFTRILLTLSETVRTKIEMNNYNLDNITILPAYHSILDFEADKLLKEINYENDGKDLKGDDDLYVNENPYLGLLLRHKIIVPSDINLQNALNDAIKLAKKDSFNEARKELYTWQDEIASRGIPAIDAAKKMDEMIYQYKGHVKDAKIKYAEKLAYTVIPITVKVANIISTGIGDVYSSAETVISFTQFGKNFKELLKGPVVKPGKMLASNVI